MAWRGTEGVRSLVSLVSTWKARRGSFVDGRGPVAGGRAMPLHAEQGASGPVHSLPSAATGPRRPAPPLLSLIRMREQHAAPQGKLVTNLARYVHATPTAQRP